MKFFILAIAAVVALAAPVHAAPYEFFYSGGGNTTNSFSASFVLDITSGGGPVTLTRGSRNGVQVTSLSTFSGADNVLSLVSPYVDMHGVAYTTLGGQNFNVALYGTSVYELTQISSPLGTFSQLTGVLSEGLIKIAQPTTPPSSVPEPMSMAIMGAALMAVGATRLKGRSAVRAN